MTRGRKGFVSHKDRAGVRAHFLILSSEAAGPAHPLDCQALVPVRHPVTPEKEDLAPSLKFPLASVGGNLWWRKGMLWEKHVEPPETIGVRFFLLRMLSRLLPPAPHHSPRSLGLALGLGLTSWSLPRVRTSRPTPQ